MDADLAMPPLQALGVALSRRLGPHVAVAVSGLQDGPFPLHPEECDAVARAVPKRRREFAAGRHNARRAMALLGEAPQAIPCGRDRAPVWPPHLVGSISHTDDACVAVVGFAEKLVSVGIDLEVDRAMDPDLWDTVCTRHELDRLQTLPPCQRGHMVTKIFSAKEAVFKWQYPLTGRWLDFQQVEVVGLGGDAESRFCARLSGMPWVLPPPGGSLVQAGRMVSWVCPSVN